MGTLQEIGGADSPLARKHRVHFQHVGVTSLPESYAERLAELFPGRFRRLADSPQASLVTRTNMIER